MVGVGTAETVIATVSVVGFIIFFGSPTAIAIISQVDPARREGPEGTNGELVALKRRSKELTDEGAIGRYFAKAFARPRTVSFVFWVSVVFGLATLTDLASVACSSLGLSVNNYPVVNSTLSASFILAFIGVSAAIYGIATLTLGAQREHAREKDKVLEDINRFQ